MKAITLQPIRESEFQNLYKLVRENKDQLIRYFPITSGENHSPEASRQYLRDLELKRKNKEMYAMGIYQDDTLIGMMYIKNLDHHIGKCELGYFIAGTHQGKGYTSSAVRSAVAFCFEELELNKVFLRIAPANKASQRIAEKNGFVKEGILRQEFRIETGKLVDVIYYGLFKEEI